jgi:predicted ATPase
MSDKVHAPLREPGTPFVGRERETALLSAALAAAVGGQPRLVLVAGEPGIGKTRLAEEFTCIVTQQAATVRWGRCWEGAGAPAFWPWMQVLRAQCAANGAADPRARLGTDPDEILRLLPELRQRPPGDHAVAPADDSGARFRLFDAVGEFLRTSAETRPPVLILEDVHRADPASLALLHFLVEEIHDARILVVATYRVRRSPPGIRWPSCWARFLTSHVCSVCSWRDSAKTKPGSSSKHWDTSAQPR